MQALQRPKNQLNLVGLPTQRCHGRRLRQQRQQSHHLAAGLLLVQLSLEGIACVLLAGTVPCDSTGCSVTPVMFMLGPKQPKSPQPAQLTKSPQSSSCCPPAPLAAAATAAGVTVPAESLLNRITCGLLGLDAGAISCLAALAVLLLSGDPPAAAAPAAALAPVAGPPALEPAAADGGG